MKTSAKNILSPILIMSLFSAPSLSLAQSANYAVSAPDLSSTHRAYKFRYDPKENYLYVKTTPNDFSATVRDGRYAGVAIKIAEMSEVEQNRPSLMARALRKTPDTVSWTMQYAFFQAALQLVALSTLATNPGHPLALVKAWDSALSTEGLVSFAGFTIADKQMTNLVKKLSVGSKFANSKMIPFIGMSAGMLASSVLGEMFNDVDFKTCARSLMTDLNHCDRAFENWALSNRIVQYMPVIIQMGGASKLSEILTKKIPYLKEEAMAARAVQVSQSAYFTAERIGMSVKAAQWLSTKVVTLASGPGVVVNLLAFMGADAIVATPAAKWVSDHYFDEQVDTNGLLQNLRLTDVVPGLNLLYHFSSSVKTMMDQSIFGMSFGDGENMARLKKDYNNAAKAAYLAKNPKANWLEKVYLDLIMSPSTQDVKLDERYINYPTDNMHIMKQAHEGILEALKFEKENDWKDFDVTSCNPQLSAAHELNVEQAQKFNRLTNLEKQCFIKIGLHDLIAKYISLSARHRTNIFAPLLGDVKEWTDALDKFISMEGISSSATQYLAWSRWAYLNNKISFNDPGMSDKALPRLALTYDAFDAKVKEISDKGFGRKSECRPGDLECEETLSKEQSHFIPETIGDLRIRNLTDYLIVQMVCGPDVSETRSVFTTGLTPMFFNLPSNISRGYGKFIDLFKGDKGPLKIDQRIFQTSDSAMLGFPLGSYPQFYPPKIVDDKADSQICKYQSVKEEVEHFNRVNQDRIKKKEISPMVYGSIRDNTFKAWSVVNGQKVLKSYHLFDYLMEHFNDAKMVLNPKNPNDIGFKSWYAQNVDPKILPTIAGFQKIYNKALDRDFFPALKAKTFTVGCERLNENVEDCLRDWKTYKVASGGLRSMDVEAYELVGLLHEIFLEKLAGPAPLTELADQFLSEFQKIGVDQDQLVNDENGQLHIDVRQAVKAIDALNKYFEEKKASHMTPLQEASAAMILKELAALVQEKETTSGWRTVNSLREAKRDLPAPTHKEMKQAESTLLRTNTH